MLKDVGVKPSVNSSSYDNIQESKEPIHYMRFYQKGGFMYRCVWVYNTLNQWVRRLIKYMAKKKVTWGTIGLSFGIALTMGIFGITATSVESMSSQVYHICLFLGALAIISFVAGYYLLNTGLDQDDNSKDETKQLIKDAIRETYEDLGVRRSFTGGVNMSIPHLPQVRIALWEQLEMMNGVGESQEVIEALAERFKITPAERELRDPTGNRTFDHRVHSAVAQSRIILWIESVEEAGRGLWKLTPAYFEDNPTINT